MECYKIIKYTEGKQFVFQVGDTFNIVDINVDGRDAYIFYSNAEVLFVANIDLAYFRPIK